MNRSSFAPDARREARLGDGVAVRNPRRHTREANKSVPGRGWVQVAELIVPESGCASTRKIG